MNLIRVGSTTSEIAVVHSEWKKRLGLKPILLRDGTWVAFSSDQLPGFKAAGKEFLSKAKDHGWVIAGFDGRPIPYDPRSRKLGFLLGAHVRIMATKYGNTKIVAVDTDGTETSMWNSDGLPTGVHMSDEYIYCANALSIAEGGDDPAKIKAAKKALKKARGRTDLKKFTSATATAMYKVKHGIKEPCFTTWRRKHKAFDITCGTTTSNFGRVWQCLGWGCDAFLAHDGQWVILSAQAYKGFVPVGREGNNYVIADTDGRPMPRKYGWVWGEHLQVTADGHAMSVSVQDGRVEHSVGTQHIRKCDAAVKAAAYKASLKGKKGKDEVYVP